MKPRIEIPVSATYHLCPRMSRPERRLCLQFFDELNDQGALQGCKATGKMDLGIEGNQEYPGEWERRCKPDPCLGILRGTEDNSGWLCSGPHAE